MLIKDITKSFIEGMEQGVRKHGFELIKRNCEVKRTVSDATQIFTLAFTKKDNRIYVDPLLRIKIKPIEDIYHQVTLKSSEYFDGTFTLGNNLFKIMSYLDKGMELDYDEKKRYLIENENDVDVLIDVIRKRFDEYAIPYFERNSSVIRADEVLNAFPREISIHNWLYPLRANLAVIAAKLNNNPRFDELITIYQEELQEAQKSYQEEFQKLKKLFESST